MVTFPSKISVSTRVNGTVLLTVIRYFLFFVFCFSENVMKICRSYDRESVISIATPPLSKMSVVMSMSSVSFCELAVIVDAVPDLVFHLFLGASEPADALLGDWLHSHSAEGLRLDLHDERAWTALLALATGARVRSVFGMALIGAHSDGFFAAHWEWTVLDAHADAWAKLSLKDSLFDGSPVALGLERLETSVAISGTSGTAGTRLDRLVLHQRTNGVLSARLRQHHAVVVGTFAFLAWMLGCGGVAICFRPSKRDGARNTGVLI